MGNGASRFGTEVRAHRVGREWSQRHLANLLHYQQPHVHRVETGEQFPTPSFAEQCDEVFGTFGTFVRLREELVERGHPDFFRDYARMEKHAVRISNYSASIITGLLQTREYAEVIFRSSNPRETTEQISARVDARAQRAETLKRENPPLLWVIVHEAALRTVIGGPRIMADQTRRLLDAGDDPNMVVQVLPLHSHGPVPAGSFTLLKQPDQTLVVYFETVTRGQLDATEASVDMAVETYDRLRASALSAPESRTMIHSVLKEYEDEPSS